MDDERGWYSVSVEMRGDELPEPVNEDAVDEFVSLLVPHHGVASFSQAQLVYGATVSVQTADVNWAVGYAFKIVTDVAAKAGLPAWDVVRIDAIREDVLDEENAREQWPDLVTVPDVAEILGVTQQRVRVLAAEHKDFPKPAYELRIGKVWLRAAIDKFYQEWERKPGRPPARKKAS